MGERSDGHAHGSRSGCDRVRSLELTGGFLDRWLREHARLRVKPSTLIRYRQLAERLKPFIGEVRLDVLSGRDIQMAYAALIDAGLSPQTVVHHHRVLRQALEQARKSGLIAVNPSDAVTVPRVEPREMRAVSARDIAVLKSVAGDDESVRLIHVAVTTGLRLGELLGLKWDDIDFERARLKVQRTVVYRQRETTLGSPKTRRSRRSIALSRQTIAVLGEQRAGQATDCHLVFPGSDGLLQPPYRVSNRFSALARRAGMNGLRFHDLRHTMATLALTAGVHVKVVSERLGHASTQITLDTYSHVVPALQEEAAETLEALLTRESTGPVRDAQPQPVLSASMNHRGTGRVPRP